VPMFESREQAKDLVEKWLSRKSVHNRGYYLYIFWGKLILFRDRQIVFLEKFSLGQSI
jgi:hypothetical protein